MLRHQMYPIVISISMYRIYRSYYCYHDWKPKLYYNFFSTAMITLGAKNFDEQPHGFDNDRITYDIFLREA